MTELSHNWHADDAEVGLLLSDETMKHTDSDSPSDYHYDADDEASAVETRPPVTDVETQQINEPGNTLIFFETQTDNE
jgi:hypothetical protein